jgi:chromosomal replication initiation ATPase DnaA
VEQLTLKFPQKNNYNIDDFYPSKSNSQALEYLQNWPNWAEAINSRILLIYGEHASGKTHLSHIWAKKSDALFIDVNHLDYSILNNNIILENIDTIEDPVAQEKLFNLINMSNEEKKYLLMTSNLSPALLNFSLPDLKSRIIAINSIAIGKPDEELLKVILMKHLSDRQLQIDAAALQYIILHVERSYNKLSLFVKKLTSLSYVTKRKITIPLIKILLSENHL